MQNQIKNEALKDQKLEELLGEFDDLYMPEIGSYKWEFQKHTMRKNFITKAYLLGKKERDEEVKHLQEALENMYLQYCSNGHDFMTAGEMASTVLERYCNYNFDDCGKIINPIKNLGKGEGKK